MKIQFHVGTKADLSFNLRHFWRIDISRFLALYIYCLKMELLGPNSSMFVEGSKMLKNVCTSFMDAPYCCVYIGNWPKVNEVFKWSTHSCTRLSISYLSANIKSSTFKQFSSMAVSFKMSYSIRSRASLKYVKCPKKDSVIKVSLESDLLFSVEIWLKVNF